MDRHIDCLPEELLGNSCCASLLDDDYDDARSFNTLAVLGASFIETWDNAEIASFAPPAIPGGRGFVSRTHASVI